MNRLELSADTAGRTFPRILRAQAQQAGDSIFLITDTQRISFADADRITNSLAAGLQALGLGEGDRMALYMGNRPEMVLLALAANKLGAIWTPINTDYRGQWLQDALQRTDCRVLVTDNDFQQRIADIRDQSGRAALVVLSDEDASLPHDAHTYSWLSAHAPVPLDDTAQHYGDTCAILWTSGTTGKSKGVLQSYNCWIRAIVSGASPQYDSREGDIIYCILPLFNTAAWITCIFRALIEGLPCVIEQKFSVSSFWERIAHFGATQTFALGAMGVFLLNAPDRPEDAATPLRVAQIVPLPPDQWPVFERRFGVRLLRSGLGQSECQMITNQVGAPADTPVYALGFPPDDIEIKLFDDNGQEVAPGEAGEICIRPLQPHVLFNGYFEDPEASAAAFRGDWYLTGDMARQDPATGAYFFVDRKKDAIRFAGRNISTLEVESVARKHPAIAEVAAFGIPSEEVASEHELKLNVVLRPGQQLAPEELCRFINDNAPHYFVPRYLDFVDTLPYTPTGKVQKFRLREQGVGAQTWDLRHSDFQLQR